MLNREEEENSTRGNGATGILDEFVIPTDSCGVAISSHDRRLDPIPVTFAKSTKSSLAQSKEVQNDEVFKSSSTRRELNHSLINDDEQDRKHKIDDSRNKVGGPESNILREERSTNTDESTNVDQKIEPLLWSGAVRCTVEAE